MPGSQTAAGRPLIYPFPQSTAKSYLQKLATNILAPLHLRGAATSVAALHRNSKALSDTPISHHTSP
jgi:hypothetical protein